MKDKNNLHLSKSLFRAYDIRGIVGKTLDLNIAYNIGKAFADLLKKRKFSSVCVAHDARLSSPDLYSSLCRGLVKQGANVYQFGLSPVSLPYFYMNSHREISTIIVTGSHNPKKYNGFKLFIDGVSLSSDELENLYEYILNNKYEISNIGTMTNLDIKDRYIEQIKKVTNYNRPVRIVIDGGNGAAGQVASDLFSSLECEVIPICCKPDGNFPNHHPDPSNPINLKMLQSAVLRFNADIGFSFDGDGDRLGVVDNGGAYVEPEHVLMVLAEEILREKINSEVVFDIKSSRNLNKFILKLGGIPIMVESGYTRVKEQMAISGGVIGGEYSGHFFLKEKFFQSDDAIFVAARFLNIIIKKEKTLKEVISALPKSVSTPEFHIDLEEGQSEVLMDKIIKNAQFKEAKLITIDGLRAEFKEGWGLVRASNTTPSLNFRFEAINMDELNKIRDKFRFLVKQVLPNEKIPF